LPKKAHSPQLVTPDGLLKKPSSAGTPICALKKSPVTGSENPENLPFFPVHQRSPGILSFPGKSGPKGNRNPPDPIRGSGHPCAPGQKKRFSGSINPDTSFPVACPEMKREKPAMLQCLATYYYPITIIPQSNKNL
jgi:hypothetical protein